MTRDDINYEVLPSGRDMDETDINLRSYFSRQSDERLREYCREWTDEQLREWDDNFTTDGNLFMICCERDVEIDEYRQVLEEHLKLRGLT
ncbi:MAG: hypothetical protein K2Y37_24305 [Pirellulales bacterium]|nr:hypothetical protein [Pirellulales bacterium]